MAKTKVLETTIAEESGPLSVYSPVRWSRLQERGYVWDKEVGFAMLRCVSDRATPVPGDPGYVIDPIPIPGDISH